MIRKLDNGSTLITLGEGTVNMGIVRTNDDDQAIGIVFTDKKEITPDAVIIQMTNIHGVASYLMGLLKLLETWEDDKNSNLRKTIQGFKAELEPLLPKAKES